jgi:glucoamylase
VRLLEEIARVSGMVLDGVPRTLFLDEEALGDPGADAISPVVAKLAALDIDVVLLSGTRSATDRLTGVRGLRVGADPPDEAARPAIGVFGGRRDPIPDCYGWYVGPGQPPEWMRRTEGRGVATTDAVLALYGTGLMQERAGAAFRASGHGQRIPDRHPYPRNAILDGISTAVAPTALLAADARGPLPGEQRGQLERSPDELVAEAYAAVAASCSAGGAIAAAPPPKGPDEPNYQFFWPRDGGQVALAMAAVAQESADDELGAAAREHLARYTSVVADLPRRPSVGTAHLAVSRFTLQGEPILEYGSPQLDGPAQTALAVLNGSADTDHALTVAAPYLDLLASPAAFGLTFDLWEFSVGQAFHALNLARRALHAGANRARAAGIPAADRYADAEQMIEKRLGDFYDERRGYLVAALDCAMPWMETISKLDAAVVGSVLAAFDVTDDAFNVDDPRIAATMRALEDHYAQRWPVNHAWRSAGHDGFGLGRFPEDTNDGLGSTGGNPWTFVTLWAAQFHLRSIQRQLYLDADDPAAAARDRHLAAARGYVRFVLAHLPVDALPEQIDRVSGAPRGARPLAWAHAELITTLLLLDEVTR